MVFEEGGDFLVLQKIQDARSAREEDEVEGLVFEEGESGVGGECDLVAAGDLRLAVDAGDGDLDARSSEYIDGSEGFNLFDVVENDDKCGRRIAGHGNQVESRGRNGEERNF